MAGGEGGVPAHPGVPEVLVTIDGILLVVGVSPWILGSMGRELTF